MFRNTSRRIQDRMKAIADYAALTRVSQKFEACAIGKIADSVVKSLRSAAEQAGVPIDKAAEVLLSKLGVPRFGKPHEVARLVAYLASEHAAYMNGSAIEIDGGSQRNI